jgi:hypothetical protein
LVSRRLVPVFLLEIRDMVRNVEEAKALSLICRVQRRNKQVKKKKDVIKKEVKEWREQFMSLLPGLMARYPYPTRGTACSSHAFF